MSEVEGQAVLPAPNRKQDPETLVLRGHPRGAIRFRKGLIVTVSGAGAFLIIALTWAALKPPVFRSVAQGDGSELAQAVHAEALADAPSSYADVPKLGPPLPGDLGGPILDRQRQLAVSSEGARGDAAEATGSERRPFASDGLSAQTAPVLVRLEGETITRPEQNSDPVPSRADGSGLEPRSIASPRSGGPDMQSRLERHDEHSLGDERSLILAAGTVIPASLITGLNSDLPGSVVAQVTENVRDSATGTMVLIPQGARLIGRYGDAVKFGQRRALLVWTRIIFPDGSSLALDKLPATDSSGYAGLEDRVDSHPWTLIKGVVLSTLLGMTSELSIGGERSGLARAIREAAQLNGSRAGNQLVARSLDVEPTLTIRPGWPVRALLTEDLDLKPWREPK